MNSVSIVFLVLMPLIFGAIVVFIKPKFVVSWTNKFNNWIIKKEKYYKKKEDIFSRYFLKPLFWSLSRIMGWTEKQFPDKFLRSGVRIILSFYFIAFFTFVVMCLAATIIGGIIGIVMCFLIFCFFLKLLSGEEETSRIRAKEILFKTAEIDKAILSDDKILRDKTGRKIGILSKGIITDDQIIEDASGNTVGRIAKSFWDKDIQIIEDSSGNKIGEIRSNFWGQRVVEDDKGNRVGVIRKNIFGQTKIE